MSTEPVSVMALVRSVPSAAAAVAPGSVNASPAASSTAAEPLSMTVGGVPVVGGVEVATGSVEVASGGVEVPVPDVPVEGMLTVPSGFPTMTERRTVDDVPDASVTE